MTNEDEYEIIPTSPLRRIEKRLDKVETGSYSNEVGRLIEQIMELIKANQRIVDDSLKANHDLIAEVAKLPRSIENLIGEMKSFMNLLKVSAEEDIAQPQISFDPLISKMDEMIETNKKGFETSQATLSTLNVIEKRLKRLYMGQGAAPSSQPTSSFNEPTPMPSMNSGPALPPPPKRIEGFK